MAHPCSRFAVQLPILAALVSMLLAVTGCSTGGGTVTTAQAAKAGQTVMGSLNEAMNASGTWGSSGPVNYSTAGLSVTGTVSTAVPSTSTYVLAIALSNYVDAATGYNLNGVINITDTANSTTASGTVNGDVTFSGGLVTTA